eukprot:jgi/Picsp_1/2290/NSC_05754-R1_protein resurrection1
MSLSQYLAKLDTPEPGRQFIVASIFQLLLGSKESARFSQKQKLQVIERCLDLNSAASLSLTVRLLVKNAVLKAEGTAPHVVQTWEAWDLLLAALATSKEKVIIAHGILELYFSSDLGGRDGIDMEGGEHGKMEGHPLVKAWAVVPESVNFFVPEIERRLVRAASRKHNSSNYEEIFGKCWLRVLPFYRYLMMRECAAESDNWSLTTESVWNGLIRLCCVYSAAKDAVLPFLIDCLDMYSMGTGRSENVMGEHALDIADVILSHDHGPGRKKVNDSHVERFIRLMVQQLSKEGALVKSDESSSMMIRRILDPLRALMPLYAEAMVPWCHVVGLCVMQFSSHSANGVACLEFLLAVLRTKSRMDSNIKMDEDDWYYMLLLLDTVCVMGMFYAQDADVRMLLESLKVAVRECWGAQPCGNKTATRLFPFDSGNVEEILSWIDQILFVMEHKKIEFLKDLEIGLLLCLLSHQSEIVRLRVLQSFKQLSRCPLFCYYAVPVVLFRIGQILSVHSATVTYKRRSSEVQQLMYSMSHLGQEPTVVPVIVKSLQPMLVPAGPESVKAVVIRVLCRLWVNSGKGFSSLRVLLLSCLKQTTEKKNADAIDIDCLVSTPLQKVVDPQGLSMASSLLTISRHDPRKGKDIIQAIHYCVESSSPVFVAAGLQSIKFLCQSRILDFYKAWRVISKKWPTLPDNDVVAASWISLMAEGLGTKSSRQEQFSEMSAGIAESIWVATGHSSATVRAQAYDALSMADWDELEELNCLRPPRQYAILLARESSSGLALKRCQNMLRQILELEYEDRRKQLIQSRPSGIPKETHSHRFATSAPKKIMKSFGIDGKAQIQVGDLNELFIILYLWVPNKGNSKAYSSMAQDLVGREALGMFEIIDLEDAEYALVGWKYFLTRWAEHLQADGEAPDSRSKTIWEVLYAKYHSCCVHESSPGTLPMAINSQLILSLVAFCCIMNGQQKQYVAETWRCVLSLIQQTKYLSSAISMLSSGFLFEAIFKYLGESSAEELLQEVENCLPGEDDESNIPDQLEIASLHALRIIVKSRCLLDVPDSKNRICGRILGWSLHLFKYVDQVKPLPLWSNKSKVAALEVISSALESFSELESRLAQIIEACGMLCFSRKDCDPSLLEGYINVYCSAISLAYKKSIIGEADVSGSLIRVRNQIQSSSPYEESGKCKGAFLLAESHMFINASRYGFVDPSGDISFTTLDLLAKETLQSIEKYPGIRTNSRNICKALAELQLFQIYHDSKSLQTSKAEIDSNGKALENLLSPSGACNQVVRHACMPILVWLCRKSMDLGKDIREGQSIESIPDTCIGFLSLALLNQAWPEGFELSHQQTTRHQCLVLLQCLACVPKLPERDWTACCRRILRRFPNDHELHTALVQFVIRHLGGGLHEQLKAFVQEDIVEPLCLLKFPKMSIRAILVLFRSIQTILETVSVDKAERFLLNLPELVNQSDKAHIQIESLLISIAFGLQGFLKSVPVEDIGNPSDLIVIALEVFLQTACQHIEVRKLSWIPEYASLFKEQTFNDITYVHEEMDLRFLDSIAKYPSTSQKLACIVLESLVHLKDDVRLRLCQNRDMFERDPVFFTWLSSCMGSSFGLNCMGLSRNYIISRMGNDTVHSIKSDTTHLIASVSNGISGWVKEEPGSHIHDVLMWIDTIAKSKHDGSSDLLHHACICGLVACYTAATKQSASTDYKILPSTPLYFLQRFPEAIQYFLRWDEQRRYSDTFKYILRSLHHLSLHDSNLHSVWIRAQIAVFGSQGISFDSIDL